MMVVMVFCGIIAGECLNRFKRRKLLLFSSIGATTSLLIFSIAGAEHVISFVPQLKYLALVGLFGYVIFYGYVREDPILMPYFSLGLGSISFFIGTELVPLQYRSSTFCVSFSLNNVLIVITSLCVQPAYEVRLFGLERIKWALFRYLEVYRLALYSLSQAYLPSCM
jgi:hypothetical protein